MHLMWNVSSLLFLIGLQYILKNIIKENNVNKKEKKNEMQKKKKKKKKNNNNNNKNNNNSGRFERRTAGSEGEIRIQ